MYIWVTQYVRQIFNEHLLFSEHFMQETERLITKVAKGSCRFVVAYFIVFINSALTKLSAVLCKLARTSAQFFPCFLVENICCCCEKCHIVVEIKEVKTPAAFSEIAIRLWHSFKPEFHLFHSRYPP